MSDTTLQKTENTTVNIPERIEQVTYFTPLVDIIETEDAFLFQADLPGVQPGSVDITYENHVLTLQGKVNPRWPADQIYLWLEHEVGHFYRQFTLNTPINAEAIHATLRNGVLELHVPKAESSKTRKIQIQSA